MASPPPDHFKLENILRQEPNTGEKATKKALFRHQKRGIGIPSTKTELFYYVGLLDPVQEVKKSNSFLCLIISDSKW